MGNEDNGNAEVKKLEIGDNLGITLTILVIVIGVTVLSLGGCTIDGYWRYKQAEVLKKPIPTSRFSETMEYPRVSEYDDEIKRLKEELKGN